MPSGHGCGSSSGSLAFSSTPLPHGGHFILSSDKKEAPSSLSAPPLDDEDSRLRPLDEDLDMGLDDNEGNEEKDPGENLNIDAAEVELLSA